MGCREAPREDEARGAWRERSDMQMKKMSVRGTGVWKNVGKRLCGGGGVGGDKPPSN